MPEVPKVVLERLRTGAPDAVHPDADLLTAFAEQMLSPTERENVLQHLAACGDCCEVVTLALPPESLPVPSVEAKEAQVVLTVKGRKSSHWYEWAGLRWAAVAAGVVVVASVLVVQPGKQKQPLVANENQPVSGPAAEQKAAIPFRDEGTLTSQTSPALVTPPESRLQDDRKLRAYGALSKKQLGTLPSTAPQKPEVALAEQDATLKPNATPQDLAVTGRNFTELMALAPAPSSTAAKSGAVPEQINPNVDATKAGQSVDRSAASSDTLVARSAAEAEAAPVQRAKIPIDDTAAKAQVVFKAKTQAAGAMTNSAYDDFSKASDGGATWQLSQGMLQRSLDAGENWQTVLRTDRPFLCHAASGNDIWAGGQAGMLFHSSNGGTTWTQVHPAVKDSKLTADVTSIETGKPGAVNVATRNGESWTTMDSGRTWEKK